MVVWVVETESDQYRREEYESGGYRQKAVSGPVPEAIGSAAGFDSRNGLQKDG